MEIKQHIKWALALMCGAVLWFGCEAGKDDYVTSALFSREQGSFTRIAVEPESLTVSQSYNNDIEQSSKMLAGRYGPAEAISVVKFLRPTQATIDSLVDVTLYFTTGAVWSKGAAEFALYAVHSDWTDQEPLDPDIFYPLGDAVATYSEDPDSLSGLVFSLPAEEINSWGNFGAYLVTATDAGMSMVSLMTEHASSSPYFELVVANNAGGLDTTKVRSYEDSYFIDTGFPPENKAVSDGYSSGFKLDIALPSSLPKPAAINMVTMTLGLGDHLIARPDGMPITISRLTEVFNPDSTIVSDTSSRISLTIDPSVTTYTLDITEFVFEWLNLDSPNYGLVFEPVNVNSSPDYAVIAPVDSMIIHYTTLPELE